MRTKVLVCVCSGNKEKDGEIQTSINWRESESIDCFWTRKKKW